MACKKGCTTGSPYCCLECPKNEDCRCDPHWMCPDIDKYKNMEDCENYYDDEQEWHG